MKINLGFEDLPYNKSSSYNAVGASRPRRLRQSDITTSEVANILEAKYHILGFFLEEHGDRIVERVAEGILQMALRPESGRGSRTDFVAKSTEDVEKMFRDMLDNRELDGHVPGVPTAAAQAGRSLRKKKLSRGPLRRGRQDRASFVDTGLYRDSFRFEVEDDNV